MTVEEMLDRLAPEPRAAFGDWDDVLVRAGISKRPQPRPRRLLAAAVLLVLVVAFFVSPAFGLLRDLIQRTDVPFSQTKSAPARVQRQFFDLSLSVPRDLSPQAIASQTRVVGRFGGRNVYMAPTKTGGFCWEVERSMGSCSLPPDIRPISVGWGLGQHRGGPLFTKQAVGTVSIRSAQSVWAVYADGSSEPIRFLWISKPIDAGIFWLRPGRMHEGVTTRLVAVVAHDSDGHTIAREDAFYTQAAPHPIPRSRRPPLPKPRPIAMPTAPFQRGAAGGVTVVVGANGIAEFRTVDKRLQHGAWGCFKFMRYHRVTPFGFSYAGQAHGDRIDLNGMTPPVDGCEVSRSNGHVWPDPQGYHAAAEIAFTERGRRWFADRAAARKLALYVRWSKHHPDAPTTGITITRSSGATTYSVASSTGKLFSVSEQAGRIIRENVSPYAGRL